ncbi:MAG: LTA synthase family protein [Bacteroidales bacterium]|nr:LTA synthase family protein [Bacteroidales bacterium]
MKEEKSIYAYLLLKLLLAVALLLLSQVAFYLCNTRIFHVDGIGEWMSILWGNIRFGFSTIVLFLSPYFILNLLPFKYRWNRVFRFFSETFLYYCPVLLVVALNCIDLCYYQFTYRRMSGAMFSYVGVGGDMGSLIPQFIVDYWYGVLIFICLVVVFLWCGALIKLGKRNPYFDYRKADQIGVVVGFLLLLFLGRGGFQWHWLKPTDAFAHCQPKNSAIVTNTAFNVLHTLSPQPLPEIHSSFVQSDTAQMSTAVSTMFRHYPFNNRSLSADSLAGTNIVVIVLESFSQEYMGCYNQGVMESYTPFLDSLAQHCTLYQGRSNGKESIEGIPAILAGIPSLSDVSYIMSPYCVESATQATLPRLLGRHGYRTAFFHGCYNGSLGFDTFCHKIGIHQYWGMDEYNADSLSLPDDYDGVWGISDEPFLQFTARKLSEFHQPFFATIFTESSHHPYKIPEPHSNDFKSGSHPLLRSVMYTDYALRRFFDTISQQLWFYNTLFVITADHPGQGLHRQYNDYDGWYNIPMMFYMPWHPVHQNNTRIVQQLDLLPSIADFLHLQDTFDCLGSSVYQSPQIGHQVVYGSGYYQLLTSDEGPDNKLSILAGTKTVGEDDNLDYLLRFLTQYKLMLSSYRQNEDTVGNVSNAFSSTRQ